MFRSPFVAMLALALSGACASALAKVDLEAYLRPPSFSAPVLSPNGQFVAVGVPVNGRVNLGVIDLASRKSVPLTSFSDYDVVSYRWVGNQRLVFSLGQRDAPNSPFNSDGGGLFVVSRDGSETRVISTTLRRFGGFIYRGMDYVRAVPGSDTEIIASARDRSIDNVDLYRVNVTTGRKELLTLSTPGRVGNWILDSKMVPRVAVSIAERDPVWIVHYRTGADAPWKELWRFNMALGPMSLPLGFMPDGKSLLVASNEGRETVGLFTHDPEANRRIEQLAAHPQFDMGANQSGERLPGLLLDPKTQDIVGFRVLAERAQTVWIDPRFQALQKSIDAAFPGLQNDFAPAPDGGRVLITSYSDRTPARWYLLDREKMAVEELGSSRPWLGPDQLVEMKPFFYKTRDGLDILGYVFLPRDRAPGERLPTVVHIHGGPWVRADTWGFGTFGSREGQILAAHGYAVVVPNFRATPGLGSKVFYTGRREFGKRMQEDIEDATDWAIKEGFADPARICLSGASYGGYASLMGIAKTPDKYRCAISGLAVTDLELLMTSGAGDIPYSPVGLALWKALAGDPATDREALRAASPAYLADRMKAPVLMYSGGVDIRVPLEQPLKMRRALEAAGKPVVWIEEPDEGHGFGVTSKNVALYERILKFLDQHIGRKP